MNKCFMEKEYQITRTIYTLAFTFTWIHSPNLCIHGNPSEFHVITGSSAD